MVYVLDSSLFSPPVGTVEAWANAIRPHNPNDADVLAATYFGFVPQYGLNPDLAIAQAIHETGWFTSVAYRDRKNMAGIGITGPGVPGANFGTIAAGIEAHYQHLSCHAYTLQTCPTNHAAPIDPRHFFHRGEPALQDIQKAPYRWAAGLPGSDPLDYVRSIVAIANVVGGTPTVADPYDRIHTSADVGPSRTLDSIRWLIVHDTEGHFAGDESVLTSAAPPVESANFLVGRVPGQCVYIVPITATAWAAGNDQVGEQAVQVELSKAPDETGYTDYQYAKLAEIYRWCVQQGMTGVPPVYLGLHPKDNNSGPEPDDPGIIGHAGVPNPNGLGASPAWGGFAGHTDPGDDFQWERFIGLLGGAPPNNKVNGHVLAGGFRALWDATQDRMRVFGWPVSEEVQATVTDEDKTSKQRTVQMFERAIFLYQPENAAPWDVVCALRTQRIKVLP